MANLNVLPQVSAKPVTPKNGVKAEVSKESPKGAELSKEFEKTLSSAADQKQPIDATAAKGKQAAQSSEKEASEKAAALALQMAIAASPLPPPATKNGVAETSENALKRDSLVKAQPNQKDLKMQPQVAHPQTAQTQATELKAAVEQQKAELNQAQALEGKTPSKQANPAQIKAHAESAMNAINGKSLSALSDDHAFDLESLDVSDARSGSAFSEGANEMKSRVPSSKLSTADYLNLRDLSQNSTKNSASNPSMNQAMNSIMKKDGISGQNQDLKSSVLNSAAIGMKAVTLGKDKKSATEEAATAKGAPVFALDRSNHFSGKVIDAPVTQDTGEKLVLSHDALHQISSQVNLMSQAKQDGEIKIRLRPDHLGDMHMTVKTEGQMVSIQIHARDGEAKKIIEESLGSLRESLSSQNLTLSRIDIVTQPQQTAQSDAGMQLDLGQFRQNNDQSSGFQQEQGSRQDRSFEDSGKPVNLNAARAASNFRARTSGSSGLDMIA